MKATTRKQLESQGIATIDSNDFWGFGEGNEFKYVLVINKKGLVFKNEGTTNYPTKAIKECINLYNEGFINE